MFSVNSHGDHIYTYNMIKWILLKILMQLRYLNKICQLFYQSEKLFITIK